MNNDISTLILLCLLWAFVIALRIDLVWKEIGLWCGAKTLPQKLIDFQRKQLRKKESKEERYSSFLWKLDKIDSWKTEPPFLYFTLATLVFTFTRDNFFPGGPSDFEIYLEYYSFLIFYGLLGIHLIICVKAWIRELNEQIFLKRNG